MFIQCDNLSINYFIYSQNSTASHRANDVIIREGLPQTISARFIYGPFDMFSLAGIHFYSMQFSR